MLFSGVGEKNGPFVFYELLCLSPCLFIDYLCIYWILFMSFWIFVIVFSGVVVRLVSAERGVLEIKTRRGDAKRMFQSKTKPKDCCNLRQREKVAGKL